MKSLKATLNGEHVTTVQYENLTELCAGIFCIDGKPDLVIQGSNVTSTKTEEFVWHDGAVQDRDIVIMEIVDSDISSKPIFGIKNETNQGDRCIFCFRSTPSEQLFKGKHALARICRLCIKDASQS